MIIGAVALLAVAFFSLKDQIVTSADSTNSGNIKMTEVLVNLNCPVDTSVITNLMEVYGDNSCPRITIKRLDLKGDNQVTIQPTFSWLTEFKSSFFPLTKDDLIEDIKGFKNGALDPKALNLIQKAQGNNADCNYSAVQANYTFKSSEMGNKNLTAYVNVQVAQGNPKVVFKILKCKVIDVNQDSDRDGVPDVRDRCPNQFGRNNGCPTPPPPGDRDGDGFNDNVDQCPNEAGRLNGCPDRDNDGVEDNRDNCPNERGTRGNRGCPERSRMKFYLDSDGKTLNFTGGNIGNEKFKIHFEDKKAGQTRRSSESILGEGEESFVINKRALGVLVSSPKVARRDYQPNASDNLNQPFTVVVRDNNGSVVLKQEVWLNCQQLN